MDRMIGLPDRTEAAPDYFTYIDRITDGDITGVLDKQMHEAMAILRGISEERSLYRYAPGKWSIREAWSHVNDAERVFTFRALWFARGYETPLPSYEQDIAAEAAQAHRIPWTRHIDEFSHIRLATLDLFRNLPADAWHRQGTASGNRVSVRALAYIAAGHAAHHLAILRERYL
jgi:hypothetical protein